MRRGRGQVLYRFLPGQMVDYSDTRVIGKVAQWHVRELTGVDMARLVDLVRSSASRFGNRIRGFPRGFSPSDFVLLEPAGVELELFPLTFFCKHCNRAFRYKSVRDFTNAVSRNNYRCPGCGQGELEQADIVHFHTCGNLETLVVPRCPDHGYECIVLEKFGSPAIKDWIWQCCDHRHGSSPRNLVRVGAHCFRHTPSQRMTHGPFRRSDIFYPESVMMINVPPLSDKALDEEVWRLVLAEYLGIAPLGTARKLASGDARLRGSVSLQEKRQKLIEDEGLDPSVVDRVMKTLEVTGDVEDVQESLEQLDRMVSLSGTALTATASQAYGYVQTISGETTRLLSREVARVQGPSAERIREAPDRLDYLGFAEAYVTTEFPLVKAVFGYSRGDPERRGSTLQAFPRHESYPGKTPVYGAQIETEAILLTLNRTRVWERLSDNGWSRGEPPSDETRLKAWFLNNVDLAAIPTFEEIPHTETVTKWVYRLTHSLSHLLIRQASAIVGLDRNSLSEVVFPNIPAFAIFANNPGGFQLGGIVTLFESGMTSWLEAATEEVEQCLYDPVCIETDTACLACLFLAEISCEHFNRELGRDVIIGSPSGEPQIGYWSGL